MVLALALRYLTAPVFRLILHLPLVPYVALFLVRTSTNVNISDVDEVHTLCSRAHLEISYTSSYERVGWIILGTFALR
jgi:hypothetical protein